MFRILPNTIIVLSFFLVVTFPAFGQSAHRYEEDMKEVDEYLLSEDYGESLYILQNLEKDGFSNARIDYKKGICYLNSVQEKDMAIQAFKSATKNIDTTYNAGDYTGGSAPAEAYFYLGNAYMANYKFDLAKEAFLRYLRFPSQNELLRNTAMRGIKECFMAKVLKKNPDDVKFSDPGENVNKGLANLNPCISGDGKTLVFTRRMKFYDAVYISHKDSSGWSEPENITTRLGSDGDFYPSGLSFDGTKMLLQTFIPMEGTGIYESELKDGKWSKVLKCKGDINSKFNDMDAVYSTDGRWIFFSSNREHGFGGYDLYRIKSAPSGPDSMAINLGSLINSPGNEESPSITDGGSTLIYSSDQGFGMGGMDYYYTRKLPSGEWSYPCNAGYPLNTPSDDLQTSFTGKSENGILSMYNPEHYSDLALYEFSTKNFSHYRIIPVNGKITLNDTILTSAEKRQVVFTDPEINDTAAITETGDSGSYMANLYPGNFYITVYHNGNQEIKQTLNIDPTGVNPGFQITTNIQTPERKKPEPKQETDTLYLSNIYFAFDKYNLTTENKQLIGQMIEKAKDYGIVSVKLTGFTDAQGSFTYNLRLSELRARAVKAFITAGYGIPGTNIHTLGKGSTGFIAINNTAGGKDNPEGRAFNRRVEIEFTLSRPGIVILKKDDVPQSLKN